MVVFFSRSLNLLACIASLLLVMFGFYLEWAQNLVPCSLCILQRGVFVLLMIVLFLGGVLNLKQRGIRLLGGATLLIAMVGVWLAQHQVWLQSLPVAPARICMPGFSYIVHNLPLNKALQAMLQGSDNCGVVDWTLFGWSIAHWSLLCFILFGLLGIVQILRPCVSKISPAF